MYLILQLHPFPTLFILFTHNLSSSFLSSPVGIFNSKGLSMSLNGLQGLDSKQPDARALINNLAILIEKSEVPSLHSSLHFTPLQCTALHCIARHEVSLHWSYNWYWVIYLFCFVLFCFVRCLLFKIDDEEYIYLICQYVCDVTSLSGLFFWSNI